MRDFRKHGEKAIAKVRREQPAAYLKILALLVPKEHKVETVGAISALSELARLVATSVARASVARRASSSTQPHTAEKLSANRMTEMVIR